MKLMEIITMIVANPQDVPAWKRIVAAIPQW